MWLGINEWNVNVVPNLQLLNSMPGGGSMDSNEDNYELEELPCNILLCLLQ